MPGGACTEEWVVSDAQQSLQGLHRCLEHQNREVPIDEINIHGGDTRLPGSLEEGVVFFLRMVHSDCLKYQPLRFHAGMLSLSGSEVRPAAETFAL